MESTHKNYEFLKFKTDTALKVQKLNFWNSFESSEIQLLKQLWKFRKVQKLNLWLRSKTKIVI